MGFSMILSLIYAIFLLITQAYLKNYCTCCCSGFYVLFQWYFFVVSFLLCSINIIPLWVGLLYENVVFVVLDFFCSQHGCDVHMHDTIACRFYGCLIIMSQKLSTLSLSFSFFPLIGKNIAGLNGCSFIFKDS